MGYTGFRLKGNNICFITDLQLIQCIAILFGLFNFSVCLFEDQIGKFDWKQNYVGQLKFAHFDTVSTAKKIIIATEENVVAALNLKSGQILWRQVLEKAQQGQIQYLHVDSDIISVSGNNPWSVRGWEPTTGRLLWEWSLALSAPIRSRRLHWFMAEDKLVQIVAVEGSHFEVTHYNAQTGQNKGTTTKMFAPWITQLSRCVVTGSIFACMSGSDSNSQLYHIDLLSEDSEVYIHPIHTFIGNTPGDIDINPLKGVVPGIILTRNNVQRIVILKGNTPKVLPNNIPGDASLLTMEYNNNHVLLYTAKQDKNYEMVGISLENGDKIEELITKLEDKYYNPSLYASICATKKDGSIACRYIISTDDRAVSLVQNTGKLVWVREEALSHIVALDFLDLPMSDLDASIETEFDIKEGDFIGMFTRRLSSQINQLRLLMFTLLGGRTPQSSAQQANLVRDDFGLHKLIIAATSVGKLYGIDNLSGKILWKRYLENVSPFSVNKKESMMLYVQRTTRHLPRPAQCVLLASDKEGGKGVVFIFNPITGEPLEGGLITMDSRVKQSLLLHKANEEFLRALLVLDENDNVFIYPEDSNALTMDVAQQTFIFTADTTTGILVGYTLAYSTPQKPIATKTWQLKLGTKEHRIKDVIGKSALERVHSQGRVLTDRSVLYKYVNPNLVAVVTHGPDPVHKYASNIYLVDVVSGVIVSSISQKRAREPIHLVHSENWLVYSYFNDKWRRTEIGTVELYEGKTQSNDTAFSSLSPPQLPMIERQSYILSAQVDTMQVTLTEKGITSKHVLMALTNGGVVEMPWIFLDPRRPSSVTPEMREEGVVPYIPELPVPHEAVINYNQTLSRVRGIYTSPSGLESTCLVFVHGLDIFYTRVAPSKTFDLLKDDFDYSLIVIVLAALLVASYVTKHLASRKALRQAWK